MKVFHSYMKFIENPKISSVLEKSNFSKSTNLMFHQKINSSKMYFNNTSSTINNSNSKEISNKEYLSLIKNTLENISDKLHLKFEELKINDADYDVNVSSDGVLQVQLGKNGTYVISRQTPTKQLV